MATVDRRWLRGWIPIGVSVVIGVAAGAWRWSSSDPAPATSAPVPSTDALVVEATSAYHFDTLEQMVTASDLVVTGEVVETARGRLVGDAANGGVVSRIVTIRVDQVLHPGAAVPVEHILVEEEGWLPDGTAIMVDDVTPSSASDRGIWFLDTLSDGDVTTHLVINSQGRYLRVGEELIGGDFDDPLVQQLQSLGFDGLVAATVDAGRRTG